MIAIDMPMPESCCDCPCNDFDFKCNLTDIVFAEEEEKGMDTAHERHRNCPLIDLTQYEDDLK